MTRSTLLAVRLPPRMLAELYDCPGILDNFRILAIGQHDESAVRLAAYGRPVNYLRDWPDEGEAWKTRNLYSGLVPACNVTHAIIAQPLQWYSIEVDAAFATFASGPHAVRRFWLESYFDRAYLDEVGALYMRDNEVRRYCYSVSPAAPIFRPVSKFSQPARVDPETIHAHFGPPSVTVVIFGQVPGDMALVDGGGLPYAEWLDAIIASNPETRFLFKQHPFGRTELANYPNVTEVDVDVLSLLDAYRYAAAYSSTVIAEGIARGVLFATGGNHAMFGHTLHIGARGHAGGLVEQLATFIPCYPDEEGARRRLGFLDRRYSLRLSDPCVLDRLTVDPARVVDWYEARA